MKIIIDDGLSSAGGAAGIGNYNNSLYEGLKELSSEEVFYRDYARLYKYPSYIRRLLYILSINTIGQFDNPDIIHFTNHYMPLVKLRNTKYAVTIYDLAVWHFPELFSKSYLRVVKSMIERALLKADIIITISKTVKNEICNMSGISEDRVYVCYCTAKKFLRPVKNPKKGNYLLFVGSIDTHKNLPVLVKAFAKVRKNPKFSKLKLVIAGKKRSGFESLRSVTCEESLEEFISIPGYLDDEQFLELYNGAEMLIMPSYYEGFGIPVIEGMACNIPVITSDIPVFREVAGDAALFYGPPKNSDKLSEAIIEILSNDSLKEQLVSNGSKRVLKYSLENFIKNHLKAYNCQGK